MNHLILAEPSEIVPVIPFALTARTGVAQKEGLQLCHLYPQALTDM